MPDRRRRPAARQPDLPDLPAEPVPTSLGTASIRREPGAPHRVTLMLGGTESSHLEFEYMQQMVAVLDAAAPPGPVRVVHLGAAGCALARALEARRPGSTQLAVELDAVLAGLVREWFDLPRSPRLRIRTGDARAAVATLAGKAWDVVVRDVFDHGEVPGHVRTRESAAEVRRVLAPDGLYLVNLTDHPPLHRARVEVATLQEVFDHVVAIADPAILRGRRYGNVVLAASRVPLPVATLDRDLRRLPLPVRLLHGPELAAFRGTVAPATDAAPPAGAAPVVPS